ncbi:MAG: hypothetical protein Q9M91_00025 [Candidatus Dojkabacteria bacterium]|nr:hypothetical protein [Candidatus Dojkabacteria bacterium]
MNKDKVITIKNLNKTFKIHSDQKESFRQLFTSLFNQGKVEEFKALTNVEAEIKQGDFLGVIGRNGSGKVHC